jgi:hypothetical protein
VFARTPLHHHSVIAVRCACDGAGAGVAASLANFYVPHTEACNTKGEHVLFTISSHCLHAWRYACLRDGIDVSGCVMPSYACSLGGKGAYFGMHTCTLLSSCGQRGVELDSHLPVGLSPFFIHACGWSVTHDNAQRPIWVMPFNVYACPFSGACWQRVCIRHFLAVVCSNQVYMQTSRLSTHLYHTIVHECRWRNVQTRP